jgi:hypothetical protein
MNTIKLKLFLLTTLALAMSGCSTITNTEVSAYQHLPYDVMPAYFPTKLYLPSDQIKVDVDKGKRVFVNVVGSPLLTTRLRKAFSMSGLTLAPSRENADVIYELEGNFIAKISSNGRIGEISLAGYAERPSDLVARVPGRSPETDAKEIEATGKPDGNVLFIAPAYEQNSYVTLTRTEGGNKTTTTVRAHNEEDYLMIPNYMFQFSIDLLVKQVGLPRNSLRVSEKSAGI